MAASAQINIPIGATPTALVASGTDADHSAGGSIAVYNSGTVDLILGGADVTAATGFRACKVGATVSIDVSEGETVYALSTSGSVAGTADVLRTK